MTSLDVLAREWVDPYVRSDEELSARLAGAPWRVVVVMGDSIAAGVREPTPGYRDLSWADRLAAALPDAVVHNLGVRDRTAAQVRDEQLERALALRPDLAVVVAGGNDLLRRSLEWPRLRDQLVALVAPLRAAGADVLTMDLLDITVSGYVPEQFARPLSARLERLAELTRAIAEEHGALHARLRDHPAAVEPGIFSRDGLHLNARGHAIVAAEIAEALRSGAGLAPSRGSSAAKE
jgi:lysophospholipase L1-like esterase